jgi:aminocarboxymuconate-semialdehyde decarboxylase
LLTGYGRTAARKHRPLGRDVRPQTVTIDIHSHVSVPEAATEVARHLDLSANPLALFSTPETKAINAQQCYYTVPIEVSVKASQVVNNGMAEYVARKPNRFIALGTVPMADGIEAANELQRAVRQLGLKGVQILTNVAGRELSDPLFAPFWAKAEELGALVVVHPNAFTEGQRLCRFYFNNVIGNPLETTIAFHYLIFDGVLERHPNLKLLAVHGGDYLGAYAGRMDHAWGARSDSRGTLPHPPSHYLKKIFVDSVVFSTDQLAALIDLFGDSHVLMGTDYPFDMAEADPVSDLASVTALSNASRAAIAGENARRLLGL